MARPMSVRTPTSQPSADRPAQRQAGAILTLALLAALLLVIAELATIASVSVDGESCEVINDASPELADRCSLSGWERHGGALILLALVTVGAALAARRGTSRAVGAILVAIGVVTLGLTLIGDLPVTNDTGAIGRDFANATGSAGLGFYLELLGGVLCLIAGALALIAARSDSESGETA
jgi:hypothetical protein